MRKARLGLENIESEADRLRTLLPSPVGVAVYNSANISIPTATWTPLTFNSERRDDADFHSTLINTDRLTVPTEKDGWYVISGHIIFAAGAGAIRLLGIQLNGTTHIGIQRAPCDATNWTYISIAVAYPLSVSDYVKLYVYHDRGSALNVLAQTQYSPEFRMVRVI